jgi:hypothetical protein
MASPGMSGRRHEVRWRPTDSSTETRANREAHLRMAVSFLNLSGHLKLLGHTDAEHLPLEPVLGRELAKVIHIQ